MIVNLILLPLLQKKGGKKYFFKYLKKYLKANIAENTT